ncbi:MAG: aromatic amino acid lyase [Polyangiaceae bacterium]
MASPARVVLNGERLTIAEVEAVARGSAPVSLGPAAEARLAAAHAALGAAIAGGEVIYGVNTGFGSLARQRLEGEQLREVQRNLILSHAAGVGEPLGADVVRAMWLLLVASLGRGLSGVRPLIAERVLALLNAGVTPRVPSVGSVGASGDFGAARARGAGVARRR